MSQPNVEQFNLMSPSQHLAFAASCCERLFPNYVAFSQIANWGDSEALQQMLDLIWEIVRGVTVPTERIAAMIESIDALVPDSEDFFVLPLLTHPAFCAASAIWTALQSCLEWNSRLASTVSQISFEAIDAYLHRVNDPETGIHEEDAAFHQWVKDAPLMKAELLKQQQDIAALLSRPDFDKEFVNALRGGSQAVGIRPFDRGIFANH